MPTSRRCRRPPVYWFSMKVEFVYGFDGQFDLIARVEIDAASGKQNLIKAGYAIDFQLTCSKQRKFVGEDVHRSMKSKAYNKLAGRRTRPYLF